VRLFGYLKGKLRNVTAEYKFVTDVTDGPQFIWLQSQYLKNDKRTALLCYLNSRLFGFAPFCVMKHNTTDCKYARVTLQCSSYCDKCFGISDNRRCGPSLSPTTRVLQRVLYFNTYDGKRSKVWVTMSYPIIRTL
jgi:hypothetical protein